MKDILSLLSGLLFVAAFVPYAIAIVRGQTKPSKTSWFIWATLDTITLVGMIKKNAVNGQIVGAVAGAWIITLLAFRYGESTWTALDKFCLAGAAIGLGLLMFGNAVLSIAASLACVLIGAFPTFASAWKDPSKEDRLAWTLFWISCVLATLAIPQWTLQDAAQPLTFLTIETVMMYLIWFHRPRLLPAR